MFDLSWSHIFILLVVALVVVGPKDLPRLMRTLGAWMGKARSMADEFRKSFDEMSRQAELEELRKEIDLLRNERPLPERNPVLLIPDDQPPAIDAVAEPHVLAAPQAAEPERPAEPAFLPGDKPPAP